MTLRTSNVKKNRRKSHEAKVRVVICLMRSLKEAREGHRKQLSCAERKHRTIQLQRLASEPFPLRTFRFKKMVPLVMRWDREALFRPNLQGYLVSIEIKSMQFKKSTRKISYQSKRMNLTTIEKKETSNNYVPVVHRI